MAANSKPQAWPPLSGPATRVEVAKFLKISERTLDYWKEKGILLPVAQPAEELSRFVRYEWETVWLFTKGKVPKVEPAAGSAAVEETAAEPAPVLS